jgi:hypothetical protein
MRKMVPLALVIAVLTGLASSSWAAPVQYSGNNHWYEAVYAPNKINWFDAKAAAEGAGGYLATITSDGENTFIFNLANHDQYFFWDGYTSIGPWLGGYQYDKTAENAGHWTWVTGEAWDYTHWNGGEPNNNGGGEDYLQIGTDHGRNYPSWNDYSGTSLVYGYMVEWNTDPSTVPLPGAVWLLGSGLLGLAGWRRLKKV